MLISLCRGPESNRYDRYQSQDFKSCASASSATPASLKRTTGFEPATPTLARWCSTTELLPQIYSFKCRLKDLNPRPSDYKSDALPTELSRLINIPMRVKGLEPPRPKAPDPKSGASANSAKPAYMTRTGLEPVTH